MLPVVVCLLHLATQRPIAEIPFERIGNRIYVKGSLNGRAVNTVLDTGAAASVADTELAESVGVKKTQSIQAGGAGAKSVQAWLVSDLKLSLTGTPVDAAIPIILPLAPLTEMEGRPLETILGYEFFRRFRVEIDYAANRIRISDPADDSIPEGATVLNVEFKQNHPHVKGRVDIPGVGVRDVEMLLDTGATTALAFTNRFVQKENLVERFKDSPEIVTGGGVGGETRGRRGRIAAAWIGDAKLDRPVIGLESTTGGATGSGATYDVLVGGEALRRYTMTLDYPHKRIFLQPNAVAKQPFYGDRTGLALKVGKEGYAVRQIVPNSPASEAGLSDADEVLAVDGRKPASLDEARQALRSEKKEIRLKVRRDGAEREVTLKLRELIP